MSSIHGLQMQGAKIEDRAKMLLRDLPEGTPQGIRTEIEVIEAEARLLKDNAQSLRTNMRPLVDG